MKKIEIFIRSTNIDKLLVEEIDVPHKNLMIHTHLVKNQIEMEEFEEKLKDLIEYFKDSAEFSELVFYNTRFFFTFTEPLKNLTHLNLIGSPTQIVLDHTSKEISLPKLKILGLKTATGLLKYFKDHELEVLKVIDTSSDNTNENINSFLLTCHHLKEIKFMGFIPQLEDIELFDFQLTSLSVLLKGQHETNSSSVLKLVQHQKSSLRDLKIIGFTTKDFVEYAISHMNLRKFEVDLTRIRSDIGDMRPNKSIKRMMLQTIALSVSQMQKVVSVCQNIEELKIVSNSNLMFSNWLLKVSQSMDNLRHLYIDSLLGILLPQNLNFKSLETLTVTKLGGDAQLLGWVQLVTRCPSVKKIIVTAWGQQFMPTYNFSSDNNATEPTFLRKNNLQFILISLPELEEIEIRGDFPLTDEVVDVLVSGHTKLRKFTFAAEVTDELMERVKRFYNTNIQCTIIKPADVKKTVKRKISDYR